eukprot:6191851-Pleurochrysis_carterae.AAC.3
MSGAAAQRNRLARDIFSSPSSGKSANTLMCSAGRELLQGLTLAGAKCKHRCASAEVMDRGCVPATIFARRSAQRVAAAIGRRCAPAALLFCLEGGECARCTVRRGLGGGGGDASYYTRVCEESDAIASAGVTIRYADADAEENGTSIPGTF